MNLSEKWLSRGSYGVYVAVTGSSWLLQGTSLPLFVKIALHGAYGADLSEGVTAAL